MDSFFKPSTSLGRSLPSFGLTATLTKGDTLSVLHCSDVVGVLNGGQSSRLEDELINTNQGDSVATKEHQQSEETHCTSLQRCCGASSMVVTDQHQPKRQCYHKEHQQSAHSSAHHLRWMFLTFKSSFDPGLL